MKTIIISGTATALSPIVHGGGQRGGTFTEFRRVKVIVDDHIEMLPVVSGNSIRGILRDTCAEFCLNAAGITKLQDIKAFHLLFSGGMLVKAGGESYINLMQERELRELLPSISLFGASIGNRIVGGKLQVGEWIPICLEFKDVLLDDYAALAKHSIYDLLDIITFTRRDDAKNRRMQQYLNEATLEIYQQHKEALAEAEEAEESGTSTQMRYDYECLVPGTQFAVEFILQNVTDIELGVFLGGLAIFATRPTIGGRASTGLGKIRFNLKQMEIGKPVVLVSEIATGKIELAQEHLRQHREQILALLEGK